jgi:hypothetical protein
MLNWVTTTHTRYYSNSWFGEKHNTIIISAITSIICIIRSSIINNSSSIRSSCSSRRISIIRSSIITIRTKSNCHLHFSTFLTKVILKHEVNYTIRLLVLCCYYVTMKVLRSPQELTPYSMIFKSGECAGQSRTCSLWASKLSCRSR